MVTLELTGEGAIRILTASTEMGQGTKTIFPQLVSEELGVPYEAVEIPQPDTAFVPDSGPTVASRTAMVVGGLLVKASHKLRHQVEHDTGGPFVDTYRDWAEKTGARGSTSGSSPIRASSSTTRRTTATRTRRSAGRRASRGSTSTSTPARSRCARWSRPMTWAA